MRTFYEILGVSRKATQEEILVAYRKRCLETHPDRGGNETDFLNVRKGYEILSNPQKRLEYDKWVKAKEDNEKKNDISQIKKRLDPWVNSFLNQYCQDDFFKNLILNYFYRVDSIYNNINRAKLNKLLTAEIIKNILVIIREDNTYNLESVLALDSICNDILLGRKDINVLQNIKTNAKETVEKNNKVKSEDATVWFFLVAVIAILSIIFILTPEETETTPNRYVEKNDTMETQTVVVENINDCNDGDDDEVQWLYNKLDKIGCVLGTYDVFKKVLQTKDGADLYYQIGKQHKIINLDKETFYKIVGYKEKKQIKTSSKSIPSYKETIYKTGDCPYLDWYGKGERDASSLSELKILNYSSTEAVVLLESSYGSVIRHVYVKNNSTYTIKNIPEGRYRMKVMYGNSWNNEKDNGSGYPKGGFMKNVSFSKSKDNELFDFVFEKTYDGVSYPTYSVTLHKVVNGNMQTESIGKDDFF